jgi:hypothetical protein
MPSSLLSLLNAFPVPTSAAAVFGWLAAICILVMFAILLVALLTVLLRLIRFLREEWTQVRNGTPLAPHEGTLGLWSTKARLTAIDGGRATATPRGGRRRGNLLAIRADPPPTSPLTRGRTQAV